MRSPPTATRRSSRRASATPRSASCGARPVSNSWPCRPTRPPGCATTASPRSTSSAWPAASSSRRWTSSGSTSGQLQVVTKRRPTLEELTDCLFAWRAVRHVRSNAIVLARNGSTVGIGAGQASRQVSVEIALRRAGDRAKLAVMASDAYFPFPDGIQAAANAGVTAIIQPGARSATRWPSRSPTGTTSRWSSPDAATSATDPAGRADLPIDRRPRRRKDAVEQLLALEMVRVTEAAAIASARFMGRGDRMEADRAATEAMRRTMDEIDMAGTIVIGEGERDKAPMLYIGEQVGRREGQPELQEIDIAVDPLEGTNLVAIGQTNAITVLAASEKGGLLHAPDTYLEKLCVGPVAAGRVDIRLSPTENLGADRLGARAERVGHHGRHPGAPAPRRADRGGPRGGRADQAHQRRRSVGGDLVRGLRHRRPRGHGHRRRAGGRDHRGGAALPRRRDPGPVPLPQRRGTGAGHGHGPRRREPGLHDRGTRVRRQPRLRGDRRDRGRPAPRRPLLRRRRARPTPW